MAKRTASKKELSKIEKFYIEKNCGNMDIEEICNDISCDKTVASKYYNECVDKAQKADTIDKMMVVDSKNGYTVMTKGASEKGEKTRRSEPNKALSKHIHKIR